MDLAELADEHLGIVDGIGHLSKTGAARTLDAKVGALRGRLPHLGLGGAKGHGAGAGVSGGWGGVDGSVDDEDENHADAETGADLEEEAVEEEEEEEETGLEANPAGAVLAGVHSETTSLSATALWQAFICGPQYEEVLTSLGASSHAVDQAQCFVVAHGEVRSRFDLVVLDPNIDRLHVKATPIDLQQDALEGGWKRFKVRTSTGASSRLTHSYLGITEQLLREVAQQGQFGVMLAPLPKRLHCGVPRPSLRLARADDDKAWSTAGVFARDSQGRVGVTGALHAVGGVNTKVSVGGRAGTVVSADTITDSCFIEVPEIGPHPWASGSAPMRGRTPGGKERVDFEGVASGAKEAVVIGWSPELPFVMRGAQLTVLTNAVTQLGDSGAALIDKNGLVLGFSFYRTGFDEVVEFASWIWAESVYMAHALA